MILGARVLLVLRIVGIPDGVSTGGINSMTGGALVCITGLGGGGGGGGGPGIEGVRNGQVICGGPVMFEGRKEGGSIGAFGRLVTS